MKTQAPTQKTVTLDTSVKGLFESLFENTILRGADEVSRPLKDSANPTIMAILGANFLRVVERVPAYRPLNLAYTSTDSKEHKGHYLPSIFLPTNETLLYAGAIMFAAGLTMEQFTSNSDNPHLNALQNEYLQNHSFDESHEWLQDLYLGIRSIEWSTQEEETAFLHLTN